MPSRPRHLAAGALLALAALTGCGSPAPAPAPDDQAATFDQALHDELVGMQERDQDERTGGPLGEGDGARTSRLEEIVAEHGWPTFDLVGEDGEDAAWLVAQHSDQDVAFQREALELLRAAVEDGQASPGNLAYLTDRVAVADGVPQTYGTQVECTPAGPTPRTPIADEASLENLRDAADLEPFADYLAEMTTLCAQAG